MSSRYSSAAMANNSAAEKNRKANDCPAAFDCSPKFKREGLH